jgi:hypothetical protein
VAGKEIAEAAVTVRDLCWPCPDLAWAIQDLKSRKVTDRMVVDRGQRAPNADQARLIVTPMMQLTSLIKFSSVISFLGYRLHGIERLVATLAGCRQQS